MPENDRSDEAEADGSQRASNRGAARRWRRWRRYVLVLAAVLLLGVAGVAWWVWKPFADRPSALSADVQRQVRDATLWADAAAAQIVLADVRADVTGGLRPDEIRGHTSDLLGRVQTAVAPLERSDELPADDVNARLVEFEEALRVADPKVTEALDALVRLVAEVGP